MEGDTVNGFVDVADKTGTVNSLGGAATILIGGTIPSFNSGIELAVVLVVEFNAYLAAGSGGTTVGGLLLVVHGGLFDHLVGIELTDNIIFVFKLGAEEFFDGVARRKT